MISSEQRSPERLVLLGTELGYIKKMNLGMRCPFCGEPWTVAEIASSNEEVWDAEPNFKNGPEGTPCVTGSAYQCVCGAWFIEGMPDEQP